VVEARGFINNCVEKAKYEDILKSPSCRTKSNTSTNELPPDSPRITNCSTGSFGSPRDLLFAILLNLLQLSIAPFSRLRTEHGRPRARGIIYTKGVVVDDVD
jgi:hypothetical protein